MHIKEILLIVYIFEKIFEYALEILNLQNIKRNLGKVPEELKGKYSEDIIIKSQNYYYDKTKLLIFSSVYNSMIMIIFIFGGLLNIYNDWVYNLVKNVYLNNLLFFILLIVIDIILNIPFDLYQTFKIEQKYEFNKMTIGLWISDLIKSLIINIILISIFTLCGLKIILSFPKFWWLIFWLFFLIFTLFLMYISPYIIEPLFYKFTNIEEGELSEKIKQIANKAEIKVSKILKVDASKRSSHTNAYFTGIGKVKRIVLFDTLLEKLNIDEICAVLAHEIGHWKKKHLLKTIILYEIMAFIIIFFAYKLINSNILLNIFGISINTLASQAILILFLFSLLSFFLSPIVSYFSRMNEKEADFYSVNLLQNNVYLIDALIKLYKDNLGNIFPHRFYVLFKYSHPPLLERIKYIRHYNLK